MSEDRRQQPDRRTGSRGDRRSVDKVPCPECGSEQSKVLPYRPRRQVDGCFSRVRQCDQGHRYETLEHVSHLPKIRSN